MFSQRKIKIKNGGEHEIFLFCLILFFVGCATPYIKDSWIGGYKDMTIQEDVFKVVFMGNGYTSITRAENFALLRSAELCKEKGFNYFVIIDVKSNFNTNMVILPSSSTTTGVITGNTYTATTTSSPTIPLLIHKPEIILTIKCFKEKPETNTIIYGAQQVIENLKKEYKLK